MIRIDALWLCNQPQDMRAGAERSSTRDPATVWRLLPASIRAAMLQDRKNGWTVAVAGESHRATDLTFRLRKHGSGQSTYRTAAIDAAALSYDVLQPPPNARISPTVA